jgi:hypothetical protein
MNENMNTGEKEKTNGLSTGRVVRAVVGIAIFGVLMGIRP